MELLKRIQEIVFDLSAVPVAGPMVNFEKSLIALNAFIFCLHNSHLSNSEFIRLIAISFQSTARTVKVLTWTWKKIRYGRKMQKQSRTLNGRTWLPVLPQSAFS